jgi:hypothetical protein
MTHESAPQTDGSKPPFDPVFPRLVSEAESPGQKLIGFLAYGLYHEARREWISDFRAREGRYPHEEELRAYERSWTASRLEALQNAAAQLITAYTDSVVTRAEKQILHSALRGNFWRGVWRWAVGALLYSFVLIALAAGLARSGIDPVGILVQIATPRP